MATRGNGRSPRAPLCSPGTQYLGHLQHVLGWAQLVVCLPPLFSEQFIKARRGGRGNLLSRARRWSGLEGHQRQLWRALPDASLHGACAQARPGLLLLALALLSGTLVRGPSPHEQKHHQHVRTLWSARAALPQWRRHARTRARTQAALGTRTVGPDGEVGAKDLTTTSTASNDFSFTLVTGLSPNDVFQASAVPYLLCHSPLALAARRLSRHPRGAAPCPHLDCCR